jgi:hypothetical protein
MSIYTHILLEEHGCFVLDCHPKRLGHLPKKCKSWVVLLKPVPSLQSFPMAPRGTFRWKRTPAQFVDVSNSETARLRNVLKCPNAKMQACAVLWSAKWRKRMPAQGFDVESPEKSRRKRENVRLRSVFEPTFDRKRTPAQCFRCWRPHWPQALLSENVRLRNVFKCQMAKTHACAAFRCEDSGTFCSC